MNSRTDTSGTRADWYDLIVLWRGQSGWASCCNGAIKIDDAVLKRAQVELDSVRKAAFLAGASFAGGQIKGVPHYVLTDSARTTLTVFDQRLRVAPRDSALIVLVDRIDRVGGPRTVVASIVVDGRFEAGPAPRSWTSGDTTFTIRVPDRSRENVMTIVKRNARAMEFLADVR